MLMAFLVIVNNGGSLMGVVGFSNKSAIVFRRDTDSNMDLYVKYSDENAVLLKDSYYRSNDIYCRFLAVTNLKDDILEYGYFLLKMLHVKAAGV